MDYEPYEEYPDWVLQNAGWYEDQRRVLRRDLVRLNAALSSLRELAEFPWHFYQPVEEFLSQLVSTSLYEHCVTVVYRLWCDTDKDSLGLRSFKNSVVRELYPEYREAVVGRLRALQMTDAVQSTVDRVHHLRHKRVGHSDQNFHAQIKSSGEWPSRLELEQVASYFDRYLAALSYPREERFDGGSSEHDVQHYLDLLALDSDFNTELEKDGRSWRWTLDEPGDPIAREEALRDLNIRRARNQLPPLSLG